MRNGNPSTPNLNCWNPLFLSYLWGMETFIKIPHKMCWFCSYPTYEEWKHCLSAKFNIAAVFVLILPMRNGNDLENLRRIIQEVVLILPMRNGNFIQYNPYLAERERFVLILPMRNGNIKRSDIMKIIEEVLILPMRNGNISTICSPYVSSVMFLSYLWGMETD